jgi:hypothetical protein
MPVTRASASVLAARARILAARACLLAACACILGACACLLAVCACALAAPAPPAAGANAPVARPARTSPLNETGHLHLTSKHNFTLNEQGSGSGTIASTIYVHLTAISSTRVKAEVEIYPRGGSIAGAGMGSYRRSGKMAYFSGALSIEHGSGSYAHAHGSGLRFSGTIDESSNDAITVHVGGTVSD